MMPESGNCSRIELIAWKGEFNKQHKSTWKIHVIPSRMAKGAVNASKNWLSLGFDSHEQEALLMHLHRKEKPAFAVCLENFTCAHGTKYVSLTRNSANAITV